MKHKVFNMSFNFYVDIEVVLLFVFILGLLLGANQHIKIEVCISKIKKSIGL